MEGDLRGAQREPRGAALPPRPLFVRIKRIAVPSQPLSLSLSLSPSSRRAHLLVVFGAHPRLRLPHALTQPLR
jgi:hypothetical protein